MTIYSLQKAIREINCNPVQRTRFMNEPGEAVADADLDPFEFDALVNRDYRALHAMGVHGLLLRPFSILFQVSEADYLAAIQAAVR